MFPSNLYGPNHANPVDRGTAAFLPLVKYLHQRLRMVMTLILTILKRLHPNHHLFLRLRLGVQVLATKVDQALQTSQLLHLRQLIVGLMAGRTIG